MVPSATRAQSAKAVEQTRIAKPRTRTQGVPTVSECQSDLGRALSIAHASAAPTSPVDRFDTSSLLVPARGPRATMYSPPATQASANTPQQAATPTTTSS
jgi:hypothetical protein